MKKCVGVFVLGDGENNENNIHTCDNNISVLCLEQVQPLLGTTHTAAYENGYAAGLRNDTITTACISYQGTAKWNDCDNGFNNGGVGPTENNKRISIWVSSGQK